MSKSCIVNLFSSGTHYYANNRKVDKVFMFHHSKVSNIEFYLIKGYVDAINKMLVHRFQ